MPLLILFTSVPLIEIALFIQVGGLIGLWPTLAIVLLTAIIGTHLVRQQGTRELNNLRKSFGTLQDPSEPLASGAMILLAGALLLTPGFFTDSIGLALLLPPVRKAVFNWARQRIKVASFEFGTDASPQQPLRSDGEIDGDFVDVTPSHRPTHDPSGWSRH